MINSNFKNGHKIYRKNEKNTQGLEVGVLVNNLTISYTLPENFKSIPSRDQLRSSAMT